jgi:hypothetical protein
MLRLLVFASLLGVFISSAAAEEAETLFPVSTKGFLASTSVADLRAAFKLTQVGELTDDETFRPLLEDLERQVDQRLGKRLGLKLDDLAGVMTGEAALGLIQPDAKTATPTPWRWWRTSKGNGPQPTPCWPR